MYSFAQKQFKKGFQDQFDQDATACVYEIKKQ